MNEKRIEIEVINTVQDYRRVLLWFRLKKLIIAGVLYLLIVTLMLWLTLFGAGANPFQGNNNSVISVIVFFALLPILLVGGIFLDIWKQSKNIEKTLEPAKFVFFDEGLKTSSKSASVEVTWDTFQKIQEIKKDFLFYPQKTFSIRFRNAHFKVIFR